MGLFHRATPKELLEIRNKIILGSAIPPLLKNGFKKSPFSTDWFGRNNHGDFNYKLCRLTSNSRLEIIDIYIARGDRWVKFKLNIFELDPQVDSLEQLENVDGVQFVLPPNSLSEMQWRSDDIKGLPLFRLRYMFGHKLKRSLTRTGLIRNVKRLTKTVQVDSDNLGHFVRLWYEMHRPLRTNWTGQPIKTETMVKE